MNMTRRPRLIHVGLGHEGHAHAHALCHLLQALLVHHVPVRHVESVRILDVELVLAQPKLALAVFYGDAGGCQVAAGGAVEELLPGALRKLLSVAILL
jgi:hypothetical protein